MFFCNDMSFNNVPRDPRMQFEFSRTVNQGKIKQFRQTGVKNMILFINSSINSFFPLVGLMCDIIYLYSLL